MLNCDKTYFLQFLTKTDHKIIMQVSLGNRKIAATQSLNFVGLTIDTSLTWKHHIVELTSRLNKACYAIKLIKPFMSLDVLRSTYFSYVQSMMFHGIIFWQLFKELNILPIQSQYIFSILLFVTKNKDQFLSNSQVHKINTKQTSNHIISYIIYFPSVNPYRIT